LTIVLKIVSIPEYKDFKNLVIKLKNVNKAVKEPLNISAIDVIPEITTLITSIINLYINLNTLLYKNSIG
jgi:hypothetical protein